MNYFESFRVSAVIGVNTGRVKAVNFGHNGFFIFELLGRQIDN